MYVCIYLSIYVSICLFMYLFYIFKVEINLWLTQVQTHLENPTDYHIRQSVKQQVKEYLSTTHATKQVPFQMPLLCIYDNVLLFFPGSASGNPSSSSPLSLFLSPLRRPSMLSQAWCRHLLLPTWAPAGALRLPPSPCTPHTCALSS